MNDVKIGIVGGAGQVGSALLNVLSRERGFQAFGICRSQVSAARVASLGLPVRVVQTGDPMQLAQECRDLDALVNCALPQYQPSTTSIANHLLAQSLAVASAGKRLVHLSSVAVYGDYLSSRPDLFHRPKPDIAYGRQKLQMEELLRRLCKKHSARCTILRVGHVYGPQCRWSEGFFDFIKTEGFRLPFNGEHPSNAIWIDNLIAGIRHVLLTDSAPDTVNLTDAPQSTWRDVFDLHSEACGWPPVPPLDPFESEQRRIAARKKGETGVAKSLVVETAAWVRNLPSSYVNSVPAFKALCQSMVARFATDGLDSKLFATYCRYFSPRTDDQSGPAILPIFLSEAVPGPSMSYEGRSAMESASALRLWHNAISTPQGFPRTSGAGPSEVVEHVPCGRPSAQ